VFTIELLDVDWDDRDNPSVLERVPLHVTRLGDAFMVAKSMLDDVKHPPPNAFQIRDEAGALVMRSWERTPRAAADK
jgi:hypothetical protein